SGARGAGDELAQLLGRRAPYAAPRAYGDALGAAVDEDLDRPGPHHRAAETALHAEPRGRFQELPRKELVDAEPELSVAGKSFIGAEVVGEPPVHGRAHRRDAPRHQEVLGLEHALDPAREAGRRLDVGDEA